MVIFSSVLIYPGIYKGKIFNIKGPTFNVETMDNIMIQGVYLVPKKKKRKEYCILYLHDTTETLGDILGYLQKLSNKIGCYVISIDYRGFGNSKGFPTEGGLLKDCESIINRIKTDDKLDKCKLVIYGKGLGANMALHFGGSSHLVITENTCKSIRDKFPSLKKIFYFDFMVSAVLFLNSWKLAQIGESNVLELEKMDTKKIKKALRTKQVL